MTDPWCLICDREVAALAAEVRLLIDGICVECWLDSVPDIHAADEIPIQLRPLARRHAITGRP